MKTALPILLLAGLFLAGMLIPQPVACQNNVNRADIVTQNFFYGIMAKQSDPNKCSRGRNFYTRVAFLRTIRNYRDFARSGSVDDSKRELAAFFAHVAHETGHFCHVEEINGRQNSDMYCDRSNSQYPCAPNKGYYGRGPLQISYNYNYGAAGNDLRLNLLGDPDLVANDVMVSFRTALWFWMENVHSVVGQGFGATIQKINSGECKGGNADQVKSRVDNYMEYCKQFGVSPGTNLRC